MKYLTGLGQSLAVPTNTIPDIDTRLNNSLMK